MASVGGILLNTGEIPKNTTNDSAPFMKSECHKGVDLPDNVITLDSVKLNNIYSAILIGQHRHIVLVLQVSNKTTFLPNVFDFTVLKCVLGRNANISDGSCLLALIMC